MKRFLHSWTRRAILCYALIAPLFSFGFYINGPRAVCPRGTYTYSASDIPFGTNAYRWELIYDNINNPRISQGQTTNTSFDVAFDSRDAGLGFLRVQAINTNLPSNADVIASFVVEINRTPPFPMAPNGGAVVFCGANETVAVASSPPIPFNTSNPSDVASCLFHCSYDWQSSAGWNFTQNVNSPTNYVSHTSNTNAIQAPGSVVNGDNGFVIISALFSECGYNANTSSTAKLWVGGPGVSNGQINGNPYGGSQYYVPGGYANLNVQIDAGSGATWTVTNGSGTLYPSYNYCSVSFSGFVRVVMTADNRCGSGGSYTFYLTTENGGYGYRVAPNPSKDNVSVIPEMQEMMGELIQDVTLYDEKGKVHRNANADQLKKAKESKKSSIDMNVRDLPRGTYFLHVKTGDEVHKHQIVLD